MRLIKFIYIFILINCLFSNQYFCQVAQCAQINDGSLNCSEPIELCQLPYRYDYTSTTLPGCSGISSLWHTFQVQNSAISLFIEDAFSPFQTAKLYGPFTDITPAICNNISAGFILPAQTVNMGAGNNEMIINIGISTGKYLLEIIDDNCTGCLTFMLNQGAFSCDCPENTNCDEPLVICEDVTQTVDCTDCGSFHNTSLFYDLQIVNPNQEVNFSVLSNFGAMNPTNFRVRIWNNTGFCLNNSAIPPIFNQSGQTAANYTFTTPGSYFVVLDQLTDCPIATIDFVGENTCEIPSIDTCESCIGSFAPIPGSKYVITAWTKEEGAANTKTSYTFPELYIHFTVPDSLSPNPNATLTVTKGPYVPSGAIIDGWQRIENEFSIPYNAIDIEIELSSNSGNVLYDDIRMFPFNASMKTFVYDPVNMRLAAELDERHYSTFYEYDEEGKLVRIKKETEKGIMTIQETKSNATK